MQSLKSKSVIDNRFEIVELLGAGGMGTVYQARQLDLERPVAIKFLQLHLLEDKDSLARFRLEAEALSSLQHRNITRFYSYGMLHGRVPYIVMEYINSPTLARCLIEESGRLTWKRTVHLMIQLCEALAHAHSMGIIHRDLKPANMFVVQEQNAESIKVSDFGLAKMIDQQLAQQKLTATGLTLGSPHYMSPEQSQGDPVGAATDIYAAGCVMYQCLFGRPPFDGDRAIEILYKKSSTPLLLPRPQLEPGLPVELFDILTQALAKDPAQRFPDAKSMGRRLEGVLETSAETTDAKARVSDWIQPSTQSKSSKHPIRQAYIAGIVALLVLGASLLVGGPSMQQFVYQQRLRNARANGDYLTAVRLQLANPNDEAELASDSAKAVKTPAFQQLPLVERQTLVQQILVTLAKWTPTQGAGIEEICNSLNGATLNTGVQSNRFGEAVSLRLCLPFEGDNHDRKLRALSVATHIWEGGENDPHRTQNIKLLGDATQENTTVGLAELERQCNTVEQAIDREDLSAATDALARLAIGVSTGKFDERRIKLLERAKCRLSQANTEGSTFIFSVLHYANAIIARYHSRVADEGAIRFYENAVEDSRRIQVGDYSRQATWEAMLGDAYAIRGDTKRAQIQYQRAIDDAHEATETPPDVELCSRLKLADITKNSDLYASVRNGKEMIGGLSHVDLGQNHMVFPTTLAALQKKLSNDIAQGLTLSACQPDEDLDRGYIDLASGRLEDAEMHFRRGLSWVLDTHDARYDWGMRGFAQVNHLRSKRSS